MLILGINAYHGDSSACIVKDGKLLAAAEEERFCRIKHFSGFPVESIRFCLKEAGARLTHVDHIALNRNPRFNLLKKLRFIVNKRPSIKLLYDRIRNAKTWLSIGQIIKANFPEDQFYGKIHYIEHHLAHLASAFFVSSFDQAIVVSIDGFGDFSSVAWGIGQGSKIHILGRVTYPNSLGVFYSAMTQYLGFPKYGDEYKVMGLASFGQPNAMNEMHQLVGLQKDGTFRLDLRYFLHHVNDVSYNWKDCAPSFQQLFSNKLITLLGPPRRNSDSISQKHKDIARSTQDMYEKAFFNLLNMLEKKYTKMALCLSGGCGMNSVANGKIKLKTQFEKVYIQPAAGDAGGAIGAALFVWNGILDNKRKCVMEHAYWGPQFSELEIRTAIEGYRKELKFERCVIQKMTDELQIINLATKYISEGKVLGWFQGRMEWGARALGNRSIVCDPRRANMKDILNKKIKKRESFRPFSPSILREDVSDWFEVDDDVPFMMKVYTIKNEKKRLIPAVTHVDDSGRLQTVIEENNPLYYNLIKGFKNITGIPILLNTSFNENEPIVCKPEEAIECFLRTKMDALVLKNFFITRLSSLDEE